MTGLMFHNDAPFEEVRTWDEAVFLASDFYEERLKYKMETIRNLPRFKRQIINLKSSLISYCEKGKAYININNLK